MHSSDNLSEGFELNDDRVDATFSLHANDPTRRVQWGTEEPKDIDLLYYTHKKVSPREKKEIDSIIEGSLSEINAILSRYI